MDALRKQVKSVIMFSTTVLDVCNVKQILTMIPRIKLLWKSYLVCNDINERYDIRQTSLPRSSTVFALQVIWGSLVSAIAYF